ncbi:DUF4328 domain-containing protein, partial [Isoptericola sp. NPDC056578]|uniref:DUF4328 domain-containing protein n=1 Tax=Isoptericola sp. NPDC056578 TaxID=3345870 RepID=UPI0036940363
PAAVPEVSMTQPDPFAPPSGAAPRETTPATPPATAPAAPPQPRFGAYAPPGYTPPSAGAPAVPAGWAPPVPAPAAPTGLATAAVALAVAWCAIQVVLLAASFQAVAPYEAALAAGGSLLEVSTPYDELGNLLLPLQVAAFVVACLWLQQCRRAAVVLSPTVRQVRGPVWVWLGWAVPVVSLWFPFQVVRDVRAAVVGGRTPGRLGWWWACWLVGLWASNQAAFSSLGLASRDPETIPVFEGLATVAVVAGGLLWVGLVREITGGLRARLAPVA